MSGQMEILQSKAKEFKVYINNGEMRRIVEWVKMKPDIETGGDLFGLWLDEHTAVVQFVLGPGEGCRRTTTSFYQDISYLDNAGSYLTKQHGLCNIGQWHSHHTIPLFEPSAGDYNTVWTNMPKLGMARYIVFIANIKDFDVTVNCFLFEIENSQKLPVKKGCREKLPGESPLRLNQAVMEVIRSGAESLNEKDQVPKPSETNSETTLITKGDRGIPGENGICDIQSTDDKDRTVFLSTSASESKKIVDNNRRENNDKSSDNIICQNDTTTTPTSSIATNTTPTSSIASNTVNNNNAKNNDNKNNTIPTTNIASTTVNNNAENNNDGNTTTLSTSIATTTVQPPSNNNAKNNDNDTTTDDNDNTTDDNTTPSTSIATTTINNNNAKNKDDTIKNNTIPITSIANITVNNNAKNDDDDTTIVNNNNESKTGTRTKLPGTSMNCGGTAFMTKSDSTLQLRRNDLENYTLSNKNESETSSNDNAKNNDSDTTTTDDNDDRNDGNTAIPTTPTTPTTVNSNNAKNNDDDDNKNNTTPSTSIATTIANNHNESKTGTQTKLSGTLMNCGGTAFMTKSDSAVQLRRSNLENYTLCNKNESQPPSDKEHPNKPPHEQQDKRASKYDNVPSNDHASPKEEQETESGQVKTVINQRVVQKEPSIIDANNEQNNPPENIGTLSRRSTLWERFQKFISCSYWS